MVCDVSSHGYRAALIMALALSASAIHAQTTPRPADMLAALLGSLRDELTSTEMFISSFYAVIDRHEGTLHYSNAGHPHAFLVSESGDAARLGATDPPLGMVDEPPHEVTRPWRAGRDLLVLFTDGVSDARGRRGGPRFGEERVLDVVRRHRAEPPARILAAVLANLAEHTLDAVQRDDQTCVIVRA
jgi:sigma-B regulation protein RsbU (phosphoserine phosphatase)